MQKMTTFCFITVLTGSVTVQFWRDLFHCFLTSSAFLKDSTILSLRWIEEVGACPHT